MKNSVTVRTMTPKDCAKVAELEKKIFSQPWSEAGFCTALDGRGNIFLVAEEAEELCGYLGMYQSLDEGEITNVAVAAEKRHSGIGRILMQEAVDRAKQQGIVRIVLEVRVSNLPAIHLYEQCGFEKCGVRKGFYDFPKEDALLMQYNQ